MVDFKQNVIIELDVRNISELSQLTETAETLEAAEDSLEGLDDSIKKVNSSLGEFDSSGFSEAAEAVDDVTLATSNAMDNIEDRSKRINKVMGDTSNTVAGLNKMMGKKLDFETELDTEGFITEVSEELGEDLVEKELTVPVAPSPDFDSQDVGHFAGQAKEFIEEVEAALEGAGSEGKITIEVDEEIDFDGFEFLKALDRELTIEPDTEGIDNVIEKMGEADEKAEELIDKKEELNLEQGILADNSDDSSDAVDGEAESFEKALGSGEGLAEVKHAVSEANDKLTKRSDTSSRALAREALNMEELEEQGINTQGLLDDLTETFRDNEEEVDNDRRSLRGLADSLDDTSDKMRAANKVGDITEDMFGSLSLNLGAFSIAMRRFTTQIPTMLAGLGALGSAATGVAGSFLTAGSAIAAALGGGALGMAQDLEAQYSSIENTGQALQVVMAELRSVMEQALSPLTEAEGTQDLFRNVAEGTAETVSLIADTFAKLMPEIQDTVSGLGESLREPIDEFVRSLSFMFVNLRDEFEAITVGLVNAMSGLVRFTTKFTNGIDESTQLLDQLIASLSEMARLGATAFAGVAPVLEMFSAAMTAVAQAINTLDQSFVANAITLTILIGVFSRFAGMIGSVISLVPNMTFAIKKADGSIISLTKSFFGFMREHGTILGGFVTLADAIEDASDEMAVFSARTNFAADELDDVDDALIKNVEAAIMTEESIEDMQTAILESALAADASEDDWEELREELTRVGIAAEGADASLEDIDASRPRVARQMAFGGAAGAGIGAGAEAGEEAADDVADGYFGRLRSKFSRENLGGGAISSLLVSMGLASEATEEVTDEVEEFGDEVVEVSVKSHAFAEGLESELDDVNDELSQAVIQSHALAEGIENADDIDIDLDTDRDMRLDPRGGTFDASEVADGSDEAADALDDVGDSANKSGGKLSKLKGKLKGVATSLGGLIGLGGGTAGGGALSGLGSTLAGISVTAAGVATALATALAALVGFVALGGLAVGVIANLDGIMQSLRSAGQATKEWMAAAGKVLKEDFINAWNAMLPLLDAGWAIIKPFVDLFEAFTGEGNSAGGMLQKLGATIAWLLDFAVAMIDAFSAIVLVVAKIIGLIIRLGVAIIDLIADGLIKFVDWLGKLSDAGDNKYFQGLVSAFETLWWFLKNIPELSMLTFEVMLEGFEDLVNRFVGGINNIIGKLNTLPGITVKEFDRVDFTREGDEGLRVTEEELSRDSQDAKEGLLGSRSNNITYNEDNSTNIDQTVNADPEDQAQLSRVVTDAIAEANSFERRRQGGQ